MVSYYIAYDPSTLEIKNWYSYTHVLDQDDEWTHVEVIPPLHYECVRVVRDDTGNPTLVRDDEKWSEKFTREMRLIRNERNRRLIDSDFSQLGDVKSEMSDEKCAEWVAYRRLLRDFPPTVTDPFNPIWPVPPE